MQDKIKILEGVFMFCEQPVIAYKTDGKLFWKNSKAEVLMSSAPDIGNSIFESITANSARGHHSGETQYGAFREMRIYDETLYIIEITNSNDKLIMLYSEPLVADYVRRSDILVRQAVTGISASCEVLNDIVEKSGDADAIFCLNNIISSCCTLMRDASLNSILSVLGENKDLPLQLTDVERFIETISDGIKRALGKKFEISTKVSKSALIRTNINLFSYLVLLLIRGLIARCGMYNSGKLLISSDVSGNNVTFTLTAVGVSVAGGYNKNTELDNEFAKILAEKLNTKFEINDSSVNIILHCAENNGEVSLSSDKVFFDDSVFSLYNIMLSDMTENLNFY